MKVKAKERGYVGGRIREVGEVFEYKGELSEWMEPVEEEKPAKPAKEEKVKPAKPAKK